jgi:hypothetical protein
VQAGEHVSKQKQQKSKQKQPSSSSTQQVHLPGLGAVNISFSGAVEDSSARPDAAVVQLLTCMASLEAAAMFSQQPTAKQWQRHADKLTECTGSMVRVHLTLRDVPIDVLKLKTEAVAVLAMVAEWLQRQPQLLDPQLIIKGLACLKEQQATAAASSSAGSRPAAAAKQNAEAGVLSNRCTIAWVYFLDLLQMLLAVGLPDAEGAAAACADAGTAAAAAASTKRAAKALAGERPAQQQRISACCGCVLLITEFFSLSALRDSAMAIDFALATHGWLR